LILIQSANPKSDPLKNFATDFPTENHDLLLNVVSESIDNDRVNHRQIEERKRRATTGTALHRRTKMTVNTDITSRLH